jgi:hypothetical protein
MASRVSSTRKHRTAYLFRRRGGVCMIASCRKAVDGSNSICARAVYKGMPIRQRKKIQDKTLRLCMPAFEVQHPGLVSQSRPSSSRAPWGTESAAGRQASKVSSHTTTTPHPPTISLHLHRLCTCIATHRIARAPAQPSTPCTISSHFRPPSAHRTHRRQQ